MNPKARTLLSEEMLESLGVVANCRMNRSRDLASYRRELGLDPLSFLNRFDNPGWLDICCGEGRALVTAAKQAPEVEIVGVDLAGHFRSDTPTNLAFYKAPLRRLKGVRLGNVDCPYEFLGADPEAGPISRGRRQWMLTIDGFVKFKSCQEKAAESRNLTGGQTEHLYSTLSHPRLG